MNHSDPGILNMYYQLSGFSRFVKGAGLAGKTVSFKEYAELCGAWNVATKKTPLPKIS